MAISGAPDAGTYFAGVCVVSRRTGVRAPLRAVQGFSRLLVEEYGPRLDDDGRDYLQRIAGAVERMDRLINDLLEYSRLGKKAAELEPVDLDRVVLDALESLSGPFADRGAQVDVATPLGVVRGHHATLVQAVFNLLSNAV